MRILALALTLALGACTTPPETGQVKTKDGLDVSEVQTIPCATWEPDSMNGKTCATIEFGDDGGIKSAQVISGREGAGTEIVRRRYDEDGNAQVEWSYKQDETRAFEGQAFVQQFRAKFVEENAELWQSLGPEIVEKLSDSATKIACGVLTGGVCNAAGKVISSE